MWVCLKMLAKPLNPMVLLIIIPIKWLFHWEYTLFSDKPMYHDVYSIASCCMFFFCLIVFFFRVGCWVDTLQKPEGTPLLSWKELKPLEEPLGFIL